MKTLPQNLLFLLCFSQLVPFPSLYVLPCNVAALMAGWVQRTEAITHFSLHCRVSFGALLLIGIFICSQLCAWKKPSFRRAQLHHFWISVLVLLTNFVFTLERHENLWRKIWLCNFEMRNSCCLVSFGFDFFLNFASIYRCEGNISVIWAAVDNFHFSSLSRFPAPCTPNVGLSDRVPIPKQSSSWGFMPVSFSILTTFPT